VRDRIAGKVLGPSDYDVLLHGAARVYAPSGKPLCVYLPGALAEQSQDETVYRVLHSLRMHRTTNRGMASGSQRLRRGGSDTPASRTESMQISSMVAGAVDPMGQQRYCRLTAWTGQHIPEFETLHPMLRIVAARLAEYVPERYAAQTAQAARTNPAWVVPGTPFTTLTVNNTYPTGVHTDKGDLDAGFSTIMCLRRGTYTGGQLVFPQYRVAVDMRDGDLILMDAHDWHGNVAIRCGCGRNLTAMCETCGAERISVVAYYRTKMAECGTPEQEFARAVAVREGS
jgi:hypothetical protein